MPRLSSLLRSTARRLTLLLLAAAASGSLAPTLQGWAWIEMAREAGGIHRIGEAMFEFAPCGRCHAAQALSQGSHEDSERPLPGERLDTLRFVATLAGTDVIPGRTGADFESGFPRCGSDCRPEDREDRPHVPPPRTFETSAIPA